eukprot:GHUV01000277.1.p1 GENE.GHUV01000277.1~~GHUV01000277.1.p1  ORF type:complete len:627 (+),score=238.35 GHUV01000277.1:276-2156(+)
MNMLFRRQLPGRAQNSLAPCSPSARQVLPAQSLGGRSRRAGRSTAGRSCTVHVHAFKQDAVQVDAPKAAVGVDVSSTEDVSKVGVDLEALKSASQTYIRDFVLPLNRATLRVYKFHEDIFNQLLVTDDLDKQLKSNRALQWATATVEAAVQDAIGIAYITGSRSKSIQSSTESPDQSPKSSIDSSNKRAVTMSDGMGTPRDAAAAAATQAAVAAGVQPEGAAAPCSATDDDEQCDVDWEALFNSVDGAEGNFEFDDVSIQHIGSTASLDFHSSDHSAAAAAVKVEQLTAEPFDVTAAHLFLQRLLYKINRLNHFWYDDLKNYTNERSAWLSHLRDMIEEPWQIWEQQQMAAAAANSNGSSAAQQQQPQSHHSITVLPELVQQYQQMSLDEMKDKLQQWYHEDVAPPLSGAQQYVVNEMSPLGYCHLLAVGSLDGLVEASRQSRVCAGVANPVSVAIFRVLMEEYGSGRYARKHSTFYKSGMEELGLDTDEEHYLDIVPWQWLATGNHNFLLTERRRNYLRYAGALSFFEINGPSVYKTYLAASTRCGLSDAASGYWSLHIKEDERHGKQMLDEVALPLVDMYPNDAWELLWGYDQDRSMGARAGAALVAHIKAADAMLHEASQQEH